MKLFKNFILSIAVLAAIGTANIQAMEKKSEVIYETGPYLDTGEDFEIKAVIKEDEKVIDILGSIAYELSDSNAEIFYFRVRPDYRNDKALRIGQHLFQQCVDNVRSLGYTKLQWTANPMDNLDIKTICSIYEKIVKKLKNSESYTLQQGELYGVYNPKVDMTLSFNNA